MAVAYADSSKSMRWCPAPGCFYGSEVETVFAKCVECPCGWMYCFKCGVEDHRPCDCDAVNEWLKRDESGGANAKWLLAYTKDCPKCRKPIEKNQGCNYMRCQHPGCQQEFCWLCLGDWKTHSSHFKCNKYDNLSQVKYFCSIFLVVKKTIFSKICLFFCFLLIFFRLFCLGRKSKNER